MDSKLTKIGYIGSFFLILYLILIYKTYYFLNAHINYYIEAYTIITTIFLFSRFIIALFYEDNHLKRFRADKYPSVSFVITCKNEEESIAKTIHACLRSDYPGEVECIAINDGSTDNTLKEMKKVQKQYGKEKVRIISFEKNRGKREGMSEGVLAAKGEIIIFVDSDSFVDKKSVKYIVSHFLSDPKVGAVSGNSRVENVSKNILTKLQSARYGISFDIFKACESVFGVVTCCPGCFSAYRREAILQVMSRWRYQKFLGTRSTFGDDRSLTNFVLRKWKVVYCRKATATTIVPEHYKKFFKQQLRWKKSWIREGFNAGAVLWRKNIIASLSFYANLIIPILGPFVIVKIFLVDVVSEHRSPIFFIIGLIAMSTLFGIYYRIIYPNRYWFFVIIFAVMHAVVLIWQMPYAILKVRDTSWGTR